MKVYETGAVLSDAEDREGAVGEMFCWRARYSNPAEDKVITPKISTVINGISFSKYSGLGAGGGTSMGAWGTNSGGGSGGKVMAGRWGGRFLILAGD